jgi:tRNA-(ms[2]io[6]A)-hydroxylase
LPLRCATPERWTRLAAANLPRFLADHAVCEQQAALTALHLLAHYADDEELVRRMGALAAEEVAHLRRVLRLLHSRGWQPARRRANPYVQELHSHIRKEREQQLKVDRLLVCALIEARSCERFERLSRAVDDPEIVSLLEDLGPAERRHWEIFYRLASRSTDAADLERRWDEWLDLESRLALRGGSSPTVHG